MLFFFQAEDGIRDLVRSRGLGDVYKRQAGGRHGRRGIFAALRHGHLVWQTVFCGEPAVLLLSLIHI